MIKYAQLAQQFDAEKMKTEVALLESSLWKDHYNTRDYVGEWTVLPLRSVNGQLENIFALPSVQDDGKIYRDTALLSACPYIQSVLSFFQCEKTSVRLMKLSAGAIIKEHRDTTLSFEDGEARIHIPVATNAGVVFYLDQEPLHLQEGSCWYLNLTMKHAVNNNGETDRIHLVIDCQVNDWLRDQLFHNAIVKAQAATQTNIGDENSKQKIIEELRRMNTVTALELAAKLENR